MEYTTLNAGLTKETIESLIRDVEVDHADWFQDASVGIIKGGTGPGANLDIRDCRVCHFNKIHWINTLCAGLMRQVNQMRYKFELHEDFVHEAIQYTVYDGNVRPQYYDIHHDDVYSDACMEQRMIRKLSMTVLLSDPSEFEGGEFVIIPDRMNLQREVQVPLQQGEAVVFPSYMLHKVNPVTKGIRRSVVMWMTGPFWA